ncbi:MAG: dTDP-4-dehydrorhamnose 3,5-epimerase [Magnetococcales bacterium]|nr:dTDP-4-dehydrorhamnose 3,5-epimerase [Magnetococcales bacterium]
MRVQKTKIEGVFHITPHVFGDDRGYFFEPYNKTNFDNALGEDITFIQDNESKSSKGVFRGFAFQKGEFAQAKLVRVTEGKVLDVVLDMRQHSKTFGMYVMHELSAENKEQVFIPRGCAHAFVTLSETATFQYKVDNAFSPEEEGGVLFNDPELGIEWPFDINTLKVGEKDLSRPLFKDAYKFD